MIVCPLRALTGLECPLCGGTHALIALLTGHWIDAFHYNPLVTLGVVVLLARAVGKRRPIVPSSAVPYLLGIAATYGVLRNIS